MEFPPLPPPTKAIKKATTNERGREGRGTPAAAHAKAIGKAVSKLPSSNDLAGTGGGGTLSITTWPHSPLLKLVGKQQVLIGLD